MCATISHKKRALFPYAVKHYKEVANNKSNKAKAQGLCAVTGLQQVLATDTVQNLNQDLVHHVCAFTGPIKVTKKDQANRKA